MEFLCKVGTPAGEVHEQAFSAQDEASLRLELEQKGYYIFSIRRRLALRGLALGARRVRTELLMLFAQELAALLKAGLALLQSLDVMLERQKDPLFRRSLAAVREKVKGGVALSEAFRAEGDLYPPILAATVLAGERSGNLETVLKRFATYLRLNQQLRKRAVSASVYPLVLLTMMLVLVAILMLKVIPAFQDFYGDMGVELPYLTRALMAVAIASRDNVLWIGLAFVGGVLFLSAWLRRDASRILVDRLLLRLPFVGGLMRMYATSQLARTLSSLLAGGLPLLNAMEVAGSSVGNRAMAAAVAAAAPLIREGKSLTVALESTRMLENLPLEMVKVGEQTGALAEMLTAIGDFYDDELENSLTTVMALIEPLMLVVMSVIVATMLLAFYLPLFEAISAIQSRG